MTKILSAIASALAALAMIAGAATLLASDTAGEQRFHRAIDLLETKGDPAAAARLFSELSTSADRHVAARALFYMAEAQKRLGQEQAQIATYKRILKEHSTQQDVVTKARALLAELQGPIIDEPHGQKPVASGDDADAWSHITPDARFLSRGDTRSTGDIIIRDMRTGHTTRLMAKTDTLEASTDHAELPMVSPDGSKVVYVWIFKDGTGRERFQLRVMASKKGAPSRALVDDKKYAYFEPIGWLPDSRAVIVTAWRPDSTSEFLWVPLSERPAQVLKTLGRRLHPGRPRLSPDGKYVAYSAMTTEPVNAQAQQEARTRGPIHIYVLATDFSNVQHEVIKGQNINESPIWASDGRRLLFVSNRDTAGFYLWSIDIANGQAVGEADYLNVNNISGRIKPVGMTNSGTLFYVPEQRGGVDVYQAELDPASGRIGKGTRLLNSVVDRSQAPSWSPDGQRVAFKRRPAADTVPPQTEPLEVVIYSRTSGTLEQWPTSAIDAGQALWLDNGRYLLVRRRADGGLSRLDTTNGQLRALESIAHSRLPPECGSHVLSQDSKTLYLSVLDPVPSGLTPEQRASFRRTRRLVAFGINTGDQHDILPARLLTMMSVLAVSPDGRSLVIAMQQDSWKKPRLVLVNVSDGKLRELAPGLVPRAGSWTKAGLFIAADTGERFEIVKVSTDDGTVSKTGLTQTRGQFFDVSPDGSRVVYSERSRNADRQLWAFHKVLSPLTPAR